MQQIKKNINTGHLITIGIFVVGIIGSVVANYYAIKYTGSSNSHQIQSIKKDVKKEVNELNARMHNLNKRVQDQNDNWSNLIERLDDRYVNEDEFDEFRKNINGRLDKIDNNVTYLIRLQVEEENR